MAADEASVKPRFSRNVLLTVFAGIVMLFFSIYFTILAGINAQATQELDNRVRNVQATYAALVGKAADVAWNLASRPDITAALQRNDRAYLGQVCREVLPRVRASTVAVIARDGRVLAGAKAPGTDDRFLERTTDPGPPAVESSGVAEDEDLRLVLFATQPIRVGDQFAGAVVIRLNVFGDHSFVDGIFKSYGVVCSVFRKDLRISTTIYQEGKRAIGTTLVNKEILEQVLKNGGVYKGRNRVLGKMYDTVYWPVLDTRGGVVGTIGIGKERDSLMRIFSVIAVGILLVMGLTWAIMTRRSISMQSLILLAVVPGLLAISCFTGWLLYRNLYAIILEGFNRKLYALSTTIAAGLDGDRLLGLLDAKNIEDPTYRQYITPLRDILKAKDVTYLYTFVIGGRKDITYIIDASPGEDFCPIGYEEEVPMQNMEGLRLVVGKGIPYTSEIQEYERYGLLKVSAAPINGRDKSVRALAGVDITITIIRKKARLALFEILAVGGVTLFLASLVSLWASRRMIEPLLTVKSAALRFAAGQYAHRSAVIEPLETKALSDAFNQVGATMAGVLEKASAEHASAESTRLRLELSRRLAGMADGGGLEKMGTLAIRWPDSRSDCADVSGGIKDGYLAIAWLADAAPDTLAAVALRTNIATIVRRILNKHGSDWAAIAALLDNLFRDRVTAFVFFNGDRGIVHSLVRRPTAVVLMDAGGQQRTVDLADAEAVLIPAGGSMLLTPPTAGPALTTPAFSADRASRCVFITLERRKSA